MQNVFNENIESEPSGSKLQKLTTSTVGVPLPSFIPKTKENHFFYKNGLSKVIPKLTVKVHSFEEECQQLWETFSANESLFDLWEFRIAWAKGHNYKMYFYTLYEKQKPVGVLPLWFNEEVKKYGWVGGSFPEDNKFLVKDREYIPLLLKIAPSPIELTAIIPNQLYEEYDTQSFVEDSPKNILDISPYHDLDSLLATYKKKVRHHLRYDFKKLQQYNPQCFWNENPGLTELEHMKKLSIERFDGSGKDDSSFNYHGTIESLENVIKNKGRYQVLFYEMKAQNKFAAIDYIVIYKNIYYLMKTGSDVLRFPGLGNYLTYVEFEDAIRRGLKKIDVLQEDNNWKHRYFNQQPLLKYTKD